MQISITGEINTFDSLVTVQSQYSASPHILNLVTSFWQNIDPKNDTQLIYDKMVNIETAQGYGLDVWGRILAMPRGYVNVDSDTKYLGFKTSITNTRLGTMNESPFYSDSHGRELLSDSAYRKYLMIKAGINIGNSTLASLNKMLFDLFPEVDIKILHVDTMVLRLVILGAMPESDKNALLNLPWLPAGVGLELYQVITPTFGFNGSGLYNFNNSTFATCDLKAAS